MTGKRGRRRKQPLVDLKETIRYRKYRRAALDGNLGRILFLEQVTDLS